MKTTAHFHGILAAWSATPAAESELPEDSSVLRLLSLQKLLP